MDTDTPMFSRPTRTDFLASQPINKDKNPHHPSLVHDASDPQALVHWVGFQNNEPMWTMSVIPNHVCYICAHMTG
jgi:hypothetical protein